MLLKYCFYKCVSADRWNANWLELSPWCLTFSDFIVCNRSVTDWTLSWSSIQWICLWQYLALDWRQNSCPGTTLIFLLFSCWAIWRVITCSPLNSICAYSVVSRVFIYASNEPLCGILIINFGINSIGACYCKQIKTSFARIKWEYKICIKNLSMGNYIYLLRQQW